MVWQRVLLRLIAAPLFFSTDTLSKRAKSYSITRCG